MNRPNRLRRSELSTPATSMKMIAKAAASDADLVFLDLEDAVAPAEKKAARSNVITALNELDWGTKTRAYRVNGAHTPWCYGDVVEVIAGAGAAVDVVIVPKIKGPRDVWFVDTLLTQLERDVGLEVGRIGIEVLIEEAEALACVEDIAASSPRLEALILGVGDLAASQGVRVGHIGVTNTATAPYPGDIWHYARNRMTVAARAHGLDAIDGPFGDFKDALCYEREAGLAATVGMLGKWCIHPSQISIANDAFAPTQREIDEATVVVNAMRDAEALGQGATRFGNIMIDAATTRIFEVVLERARLCGSLAETASAAASDSQGRVAS